MAIWFQTFTLEQLRDRQLNTLDQQLGISFSAHGDDWLAATMPVDARTRQPFGLLHGGASAALAESVGSVAGCLCVDPAKYRCVGQSIVANHVRGARDGVVTGTARALHLGGRSQVWEIDIRDPAGALVCISTLTLAVVGAPR
jgi:1,4-dihydroxy-2-naphthoyl-CoA hydrolase